MPGSDGRTLKSDWPDPPFNAVYHTPHWWGWEGYGFSVASAPPAPWPFSEGPWPVDKYGPAGTVWVFDVSDVVGRLIGLPGIATKAAANRLLRKLGARVELGSVWEWRTPFSPDDERRSVMKVLRTTIHGKIGTAEEVAHVLHWRAAPVADVAIDQAGVQAMGVSVRDAWIAFLNSNASAGVPVKSLLPPELIYDEVRSAYLTVTAGVPKPTYDIPTQYTTFGAGTAVGTEGSTTLPYEVACCLSLNTNLRGPRNRGRVYIGPLGFSSLATRGGLFDTNKMRGLAARFGDVFVAPLNSTSPFDLHVASFKYATTQAVQGVRVGAVPDSQRRRRRNLPESAFQAWGTAVGG